MGEVNGYWMKEYKVGLYTAHSSYKS